MNAEVDAATVLEVLAGFAEHDPKHYLEHDGLLIIAASGCTRSPNRRPAAAARP